MNKRIFFILLAWLAFMGGLLVAISLRMNDHNFVCSLLWIFVGWSVFSWGVDKAVDLPFSEPE